MKKKNKIRIIGDKIDLASLAKEIPGIIVKINKNSITLTRKQMTNGKKPNSEITIKRFMNAEDFAQMLGLYRAEGLKKPERVRFANNNITLHKWFIESLRQMGIYKLRVYTYCCFCRKCESEKLRKAIKTFEKVVGVKIRGKYRDEFAHNPMFYTDVNNKPLAIFLNHAEMIFRKEAAKGNIPKPLVAKYLRGMFHGDGYVRLRRHDLAMDIEFWEKDANAAKDLKQILKRYYGLTLRTYYKYSHKCSISTEELLAMLVDDIIPRKHMEKVKKKLRNAYERKRLPWILMQLFKAFGVDPFTVPEASKVLQKAKNHTREKLIELQKKGYLTSIKTKIIANGAGTPMRRIFKLTSKALKIVKLLCLLL
ncbi:MAG: LAGLIDADG family homing endonuclease [Nitrososphaerota archaeon]